MDTLRADMPGGSLFLLKGAVTQQKPNKAQWQLRTGDVSPPIPAKKKKRQLPKLITSIQSRVHLKNMTQFLRTAN